MSGGAQAWFVAGTIPLIVAGALHALATLVDLARPTYFTPVDARLRPALEGTGIRLRAMFPGGSADAPSLWRVWLGVHVSHGLGVMTFGLLLLLLVAHDPRLVVEIDAVRPLSVAFPAAFLVLSLRFWFYGPALVTGSSTLCFAVAAALSA